MRRPITRDDHIAWINALGEQVVFDLPTHCEACQRCLISSRTQRCPFGGPFRANLVVAGSFLDPRPWEENCAPKMGHHPFVQPV